MSVVQAPVSDMAVTVKSREIQRGILAEMRGDRAAAGKHFLAAAHLELVLADDYAAAGEPEISLRSSLSAVSCLWRSGHTERASNLCDGLMATSPQDAPEIQEIMDDLRDRYPPSDS